MDGFDALLRLDPTPFEVVLHLDTIVSVTENSSLHRRQMAGSYNVISEQTDIIRFLGLDPCQRT
jgi:hypothetical protein